MFLSQTERCSKRREAHLSFNESLSTYNQVVCTRLSSSKVRCACSEPGNKATCFLYLHAVPADQVLSVSVLAGARVTAERVHRPGERPVGSGHRGRPPLRITRAGVY